MKKLVQLIPPDARLIAVVVGLLAVTSGLLSAGLVALGNKALHSVAEQSGSYLLIGGFVAVGAGKLVSGYFSEVLLTRYCLDSIVRLRAAMVTKILRLPLRRYEQAGRHRVLAALTEDMGAISHALAVLPGMVVNCAIAGGAAIYLCWLSPKVFGLLVLGGGIGLTIYRMLARRAERHWEKARDLNDMLFQHFRTFTEGVKELKMHAGRREQFLQADLEKASQSYSDQCVTATKRYTFAHSLSHAVILLLMAGLLFWIPETGLLSAEALSGFVLTLIFLLGPVSGIVFSVPAIVRARIARGRVAKLGVQLSEEMNRNEQVDESVGLVLKADWILLSLRGVCFTYQDPGSRNFSVGPIDLDVSRGEMIFLTGSNGSGKTTLGKIIGGLYEPESGKILLDDVCVDSCNRDLYRQHFSAVFSDLHLFKHIVPTGAELDVGQAGKYLEMLGLNDVVHLTPDGVLSTTTALSTGQRKRVALLSAYLEDRDILLFDEWAADQDPMFRKTFYETILPDLQKMGKTIVVITHDDRYFHCAQRLVRLVDGTVDTAEQKGGPLTAIQNSERELQVLG